MPDVVFRFDHASCEAMMEINAHPPPVEDDLLKLFAEIKKHTRLTRLVYVERSNNQSVAGFSQSKRPSENP